MTAGNRHRIARKILRAYLARNAVALADVEGVFRLITGALDRLADAPEDPSDVPEGPGEPPETDPTANPFPGWLAQNRLTVREAARVLGASTAGVQAWKRERPPGQVLLACAAVSAGCALPSDPTGEGNPFLTWMDGRGLSMRGAARLLDTSTSAIQRWRRGEPPRRYVLLACAAISAGLEPIAYQAPEPVPPPVVALTAAEIAASIRPDALISFIDGKPYKLLGRHLAAHGLNMARYRARYGLPTDYPKACAEFAAERSTLSRRTSWMVRDRG